MRDPFHQSWIYLLINLIFENIFEIRSHQKFKNDLTKVFDLHPNSLQIFNFNGTSAFSSAIPGSKHLWIKTCQIAMLENWYGSMRWFYEFSGQ